MNVAILGSGFGLYGYLPALQGERCRVVLPERYRAVVAGRAELSGLAAGVLWVADEKEALDLADAVVVARRPADQAGLITELLDRPRLRRLLLEKPLAPSPGAAMHLQDKLELSDKIVRIGYSLGFTGWGRQLTTRAAASLGDIRIGWRFRAHHYATGQSNWKRFHAQGGGALRFYGIQLISLLAAIGFDRASASSIASALSDEAESWRATLSNGKGAACEIELDSNSAQTEFSISAPLSGLEISLPDPFDGVASGGQDRRVPVLSLLCRELLTSEQPLHQHYRKTIELWRAIEAVTIRR
jgi:predicted dehydrogenase